MPEREYIVGIPNNCCFRERNEETDEVWCDLAKEEELDCPNDTIFPQLCPLLKESVKVMII